MLGIAPSSLIRLGDFKRLGLKPTSDYEALLQLIAKHPVDHGTAHRGRR